MCVCNERFTFYVFSKSAARWNRAERKDAEPRTTFASVSHLDINQDAGSLNVATIPEEVGEGVEEGVTRDAAVVTLRSSPNRVAHSRIP